MSPEHGNFAPHSPQPARIRLHSVAYWRSKSAYVTFLFSTPNHGKFYVDIFLTYYPVFSSSLFYAEKWVSCLICQTSNIGNLQYGSSFFCHVSPRNPGRPAIEACVNCICTCAIHWSGFCMLIFILPCVQWILIGHHFNGTFVRWLANVWERTHDFILDLLKLLFVG